MNKQIPWDLIIKRFKHEISAEEQASLDLWLANETHQAVYYEMQALWGTLVQEGITYQSNADELWQRMEVRMKKLEPKVVNITLARLRWIAVAASFLLILMGSFTGYIGKQWYESNTVMQTYSSLNGKSKVTLPDGSEVWLNAESYLEYSTQAWSKERNVRLEGEAFFKVSENRDRPFIVKSEGVQVVVHGTVFDVEARAKSNKLNVSLLSGSVAVQSDSDSRLIEPGQMAVYTKNTGDISVEKSDVEFAAMWAKETVRFERKSIKELSRYLSKWYGVKIILDPTIPEDQAYTFTVTSEPFEEILRLMARTNPIAYSFDEKNVVKITKK